MEAEVTDLTGRQNACCVDIDFAQEPDGSIELEQEFEYWRGITPSLSLIWRF
jgi:hypothetical protein